MLFIFYLLALLARSLVTASSSSDLSVANSDKASTFHHIYYLNIADFMFFHTCSPLTHAR